MKGRILIMTMMKIDTLELTVKYLILLKSYIIRIEKNTTTNISRKTLGKFPIID